MQVTECFDTDAVQCSSTASTFFSLLEVWSACKPLCYSVQTAWTVQRHKWLNRLLCLRINQLCVCVCVRACFMMSQPSKQRTQTNLSDR